jgi:hypothetical protein
MLVFSKKSREASVSGAKKAKSRIVRIFRKVARV